MNANPIQTFNNLIRYDTEEFPFVDRFSQFGLVFPRGRALGSGQLQVRSMILNQPAADMHLTVWIQAADRLYRVSRTELECLPWETRERGFAETEHGRVTVTARHVFLDEVRAVSTFTLEAAGADVSVHPVFLGQFSREQRAGAELLGRYGAADAKPRRTFAETNGHAVTGGLVNDPEAESGKAPFLPAPAARITPIGGMPVSASVSDAPHWMSGSTERTGAHERLHADRQCIFYRFDAGTVSVAAGEKAGVAFLTELSVQTYRDREHHWDGAPDRLAQAADGADTSALADAAAQASRTAFLERVGWDDPPQVPPEGLAQAWRARWALTRTGYRANDRGGEFARLVASTCVPSSHGFTKAFFWDALFSSAAASQFCPELATGAILAQFVRQDENGYCPEHGYNYHISGRSHIGAPQAPVAGWAVDKYLRANGEDRDFLEQIYPILVRNHRYWQEFSDQDRDGLSEWTWTGQTADNSPLWDEVVTRSVFAGCSWIPPVASVQLNSFLFRDARHLAEIAERLGHHDEAKAYGDRAGALQEALMRICYLPEEKRFWDYNHATGRHTRVPTFYMFWPIWAGMDVPQEAKTDLIERVLLDPEQLFGPVPFPSVAYNHPAYEPAGYWRGKNWPQITYWLLEMLVAEGYERQADEAARRFLAVYDREPSFPENLTTDASVYDAGGVADYNWGVAAYYLISTGAYRQ